MKADEEARALALTAQRLSRRFPTVPKEIVFGHVDRVAATLDHAKVRDYVPLLVEREVRDLLTRLTRDPLFPLSNRDDFEVAS